MRRRDGIRYDLTTLRLTDRDLRDGWWSIAHFDSDGVISRYDGITRDNSQGIQTEQTGKIREIDPPTYLSVVT